MSYTDDLSEGFFVDLRAVCGRLVCAPLDLLSVAYSESGCKASAKNPTADANGLIQFMGPTLRALGWNQGGEAFRQLTAQEQLPYVEKYFRSYRGYLKNAAYLYVATFLPACLPRARSNDFVLCAKDGPFGWAYAANAVFDRNRNYSITVGELLQAIKRNCVGPRWEEIVKRLDEPPMILAGWTIPAPAATDLRSTQGLQIVLTGLGYNVGEADGVPGPLLATGVENFQRDQGLKVDGIPGPVTRMALASLITQVPV